MVRYVLAYLVFAVSSLGANTVQVPADQPTIQAGIDSASAGDTVLVADGIYRGAGNENRDIDFHGKAVVLMSENGPESCIIDAQATEEDRHHVFHIHNGEGPDTKIVGLTIRGGYRGRDYEGGGGAYLDTSSPSFENCVFENNYGYWGGAIRARRSNSVFIRCLIRDNQAVNGGGVSIESTGGPEFVNCTMIANRADSGAGAVHVRYWSYDTKLTRCLIAFNLGAPGITANLPSIVCSNIHGNPEGNYIGESGVFLGQDGNISVNPRLCDWALGRYDLDSLSPCLPANSEYGQLIGRDSGTCAPGGRVWHVRADGSGDATTIQDAVNAAHHGDTILLASGTYTGDGNRDLNLWGKILTIQSAEGSRSCIIDAGGSENEPHRAFHFRYGEGPSTEIVGLTLRGGYHGAVNEGGGAVYLDGSSPAIEDCSFEENYAYFGGSVYARESNSVLSRCVIFDNQAVYGGGVSCEGDAGPEFINCDIVANDADSGAGGVYILDEESDAELTRCNVTYNLGVQALGGCVPSVTCCNIFGNPRGNFIGEFAGLLGQNGNVSVDPRFCDLDNGDTHLNFDSPCLPDHNSCGMIGALGTGCTEVVWPLAGRPRLSGDLPAYIVRTLTPNLEWDYWDTACTGQEYFEVEIGTDQDWTYAEMWDSSPIRSAATTVQYAGAPLADRSVYYLRVRLANEHGWGDWTEQYFSTRLLPEGEISSNWSQYQYDSKHTGYNPGTKITMPLQLKWQQRVFPSNLNPITATEEYVMASPGEGPSTLPNVFSCLDSETGETLWADSVGWVSSTPQPSTAYGLWYQQIIDGAASRIVAYDVETGDTAWICPFRSQLIEGLKSPTVYGDRLVFPSEMYGGFSVADIHTGERLWAHGAGRQDAWTPAVYNDSIYIYFTNLLWTCDLSKDELGWDLRDTLPPCEGGPPVHVYFAGTAPVIDSCLNFLYILEMFQIQAIDLETGEIAWRNCGHFRTYGRSQSPVVCDGLLLVRESGRLVCYDAFTGEELWDYRAPTPIVSQPIAIDGHAFVGTEEATYAVDLNTHDAVWSYPVVGSVTAAGDKVYVSTVDGWIHAFGQVSSDVGEAEQPLLPVSMELCQNFPNPFNPSTTIRYALPKRSHVRLTVYNILGQEVAELINSAKTAGEHVAIWDGHDAKHRSVSTGVYFYRLQAGDHSVTRKMLLLK